MSSKNKKKRNNNENKTTETPKPSGAHSNDLPCGGDNSISGKKRRESSIGREEKDYKVYKTVYDPAYMKTLKTKDFVRRYNGKCGEKYKQFDYPHSPKDPRVQYRRFEQPKDIKVPNFIMDDEYIGIPPKREVTISNLNDNVDEKFLRDMANDQMLFPQEVVVFYHPINRKHLTMAFILFKNSKTALEFVYSNYGRSVMGRPISCKLDPFAAELSEMYWEKVKEPLPTLGHMSRMSEHELSLRREKITGRAAAGVSANDAAVNKEKSLTPMDTSNSPLVGAWSTPSAIGSAISKDSFDREMERRSRREKRRHISTSSSSSDASADEGDFPKRSSQGEVKTKKTISRVFRKFGRYLSPELDSNDDNRILKEVKTVTDKRRTEQSISQKGATESQPKEDEQNQPPPDSRPSTAPCSPSMAGSLSRGFQSVPLFDPSRPPPSVVPPTRLVLPDFSVPPPPVQIPLPNMMVPPPPLLSAFIPPPKFFGLQSPPPPPAQMPVPLMMVPPPPLLGVFMPPPQLFALQSTPAMVCATSAAAIAGLPPCPIPPVMPPMVSPMGGYGTSYAPPPILIITPHKPKESPAAATISSSSARASSSTSLSTAGSTPVSATPPNSPDGSNSSAASAAAAEKKPNLDDRLSQLFGLGKAKKGEEAREMKHDGSAPSISTMALERRKRDDDKADGVPSSSAVGKTEKSPTIQRPKDESLTTNRELSSGGKPNLTHATTPNEEKQGINGGMKNEKEEGKKESKDENQLSSGTGKRKADEAEVGGGPTAVTAAASSSFLPPPTKKLAADEVKKETRSIVSSATPKDEKKEKGKNSPSSPPSVSSNRREERVFIPLFTMKELMERYEKIKGEKYIALRKLNEK